MKLLNEKTDFQPFTLSIKVETINDLLELYNRFTAPGSELDKIMYIPNLNQPDHWDHSHAIKTFLTKKVEELPT